MSDPINSAVERASAPAPTRFNGEIKLPSGEIAVVNLPASFSYLDALALVKVIAEFSVQVHQEQTPEQAARKRLVLPS